MLRTQNSGMSAHAAGRLKTAQVQFGEGKTKLLGAIEHAWTSLKLTVVLRLIGLSPSRHHAWTKRQKECALDDRSSCPRSSPGQVTATRQMDAAWVRHDRAFVLPSSEQSSAEEAFPCITVRTRQSPRWS